MSFPKNFAWGVATAAYQIEGAAADREPSVWDMFCRRPGAIWGGATGEAACDHVHRYREDVELMRQLGVGAYRFSISWTRARTEQGLDFYSRLVDALLSAQIQPYVTLFHWDYPYDLYCRGGWLNPDSPAWFEEYTRRVVSRLGDRVPVWITMNEPQCFIVLGHQKGIHAPGDKLGMAEALRAGHHALLAHGRAVQVIRSLSKAQVGFAPVGIMRIPKTEADAAAAREATFRVEDLWCSAWWMDPVYLGRYPEDGLKKFEPHLPRIGTNDLNLISRPLDFFGANFYNDPYIHEGREVPFAPGHPLTAFYWPVTPEVLRWGPRFFYERYRKPIVVTENGMANVDWVSLDGGVHDPQRIDFTKRYLIELRKAIEDGVDVRGYMHWTLMDNFEWAEGFRQRFGLVYTDFATGRRTAKDSFEWYARVIATNGAEL
jgi:beta-glucosidase